MARGLYPADREDSSDANRCSNRASSRCSSSVPAIRSSGSSSRTSPAAATAGSSPSRTATASLDALCHLGANLVPSGKRLRRLRRGRGLGRSLEDDHRRGAGSRRALGRGRGCCMPEPRADRPGQPVYAIAEPPADGASGLRAATLDDLERLIPVCAAAHARGARRRPARARPRGRFAGGPGPRSSRAARGSGSRTTCVLFKAEASAWTPGAVQVQQVWVDPDVRGRGYGARGMRDLCRLLLAR